MYTYITGFIAGASLVAFIIIYIKYSSLKNSIDSLKNENIKFKEDMDKRVARYKSYGWYKTSEKDDPNKYTWNVSYDLKKVSTSEDRVKSKFEVISITSENIKNIEDCSYGSTTFNFYKDYFIKQTGGGWLRNSDLEWVIDLPKDEVREQKLKELGIIK